MEEKDTKIETETENKCDEKCGCNANYLLIGIAVIFIVMYFAITI